MAPVQLFAEGLFAYVTCEEGFVCVERSGHVARLPMDGMLAYTDGDVVMADTAMVIARLELNCQWLADECQVIVESKKCGPRKLTPAEEKLPYAKYYNRYWETPYHERADFKSWSRKAALYAGNNMQDPAKMLHLSDVNKIMDPEYRKNQWNEGWTLFDDGSGVMCAKTEFPGTTAEMFKWWFAWHPLEDIQYMLCCPPSHYRITTSLELRQRLKTRPILSIAFRSLEKPCCRCSTKSGVGRMKTWRRQRQTNKGQSEYDLPLVQLYVPEGGRILWSGG